MTSYVSVRTYGLCWTLLDFARHGNSILKFHDTMPFLSINNFECKLPNFTCVNAGYSQNALNASYIIYPNNNVLRQLGNKYLLIDIKCSIRMYNMNCLRCRP